MKKFFVIGLLLASITTWSQNDKEPFLASQQYYFVTARSAAMGSAFGALGGDMISASQNPAGIGVYATSEIAFSPTLSYNKTTSSFDGYGASDFRFNFALGNIGYIVHMDLGGDIEALNLGITYNRLNSFHQNQFIYSDKSTGSLLDEFSYYANNGLGRKTYEDLAYYTNLILPLPSSDYYVNDFTYYNIDKPYGHILERSVSKTGRIGETAISGGINVSDKMYYGLTIGIQDMYYEEITNHYENSDGASFPSDQIYFRDFSFKENLYMSGTGINFKFGSIFRPFDFLRLGVAFHTPTTMYLTGEFNTIMNASFNNDSAMYYSSYSDVFTNDFRSVSPLKAMGSLAVLFGKVGLLSVDYEYADYSTMMVRSNEDNFRDIQKTIKDTYKATNNVRAGLEFRDGIISYRLGAAYYESPYKNTTINTFDRIMYSGGIGFRGKVTYFDFTYALNKLKYSEYPFMDSPKATLTSNTGRFIATLGFRF